MMVNKRKLRIRIRKQINFRNLVRLPNNFSREDMSSQVLGDGINRMKKSDKNKKQYGKASKKKEHIVIINCYISEVKEDVHL